MLSAIDCCQCGQSMAIDDDDETIVCEHCDAMLFVDEQGNTSLIE